MRSTSGHLASLKHHARRLKHHGVKTARRVHAHALSTPKRIIISSALFVVVAIITAQFFYPANATAWFSKVDGITIGGAAKEDAIKALNMAYANAVVPVYYSDQTDTPKEEPTLSDIGVNVDNSERVNSYLYPWYWRLVPSSALWYHAVVRSEPIAVSKDSKQLDEYMNQTFGADCTIAPKNATISLENGGLKLVKSSDGGTCDYSELHGKFEATKASLNPDRITVAGTTIEPEVNNEVAEKVLSNVEEKIREGVPIAVNGKNETIPKDTIVTWLVFSANGNNLDYSINDAGAKWLTDSYAKSVAIAAGVSKVTTRDFIETSRVDGPAGRSINVQATSDAVVGYIRGEAAAEVKTQAVAPTVSYTRSYSPTDTGMTALLKHFAESHPGTYGISFAELSGARRHASYNGDTQFITASTYKLFVAYSSLLRIERGEWKWSDQINGGRDLTKCLDDMIVKSDNACADTLLRKIGFSNITNEAKAIGASKTSFLGGDGIKSTAQDQVVFLSALQSGQLLSQQANRDILINAMKRNVYRKGIPAGTSGTVANKVGFLDGLLHDSGIVYSPSGTYVLVILTNNSSWANIAELTRQIEALRAS